MSKEIILSDIAGGNQTERVDIGVIERNRAAAYASFRTGTDLGRAIDRLQAEARSKDNGGEWAPATGRAAVEALWRESAAKFKNEVAPLGHRGKLFCTLAMLERMPVRCGQCQGVGEIRYHGKPVVTCGDCRGSGKQLMTDATRAKALGKALTDFETKALHCILLTWDQHDHASSSAVGDMYREEL